MSLFVGRVYVGTKQQLDDAIWACACTFCGAKAGDTCIQKPRYGHPPARTLVPHMPRVKAGHKLLRSQEESCAQPSA